MLSFQLVLEGLCLILLYLSFGCPVLGVLATVDLSIWVSLSSWSVVMGA